MLDGTQPDKRVRAKRAQTWCAALSRLFLLHHRGQGELPREVTFALAMLFEDMSRGIVPGPFADVADKKRGDKVTSSLEARDIQAACDYVALKGKGRRSEAIAEICEIYEVRPTTVYGWLATSHKWDVSTADPEFIIERAIVGGERYRLKGRSCEAKSRRSRAAQPVTAKSPIRRNCS